MRSLSRLFGTVATAAFAVTVGYFSLTLILLKTPLTRREQQVGALALGLVLLGVAGLWMFRKLRAQYLRQEARSAAIAFVVLAPVGLGIGFLLGQISGGYSEVFLGTVFALPGAVLGAALTFSILSFMVVLFALWNSRQHYRD